MTPEMIEVFGKYSSHTLLLIAVFYLVKAILYLNSKREEQEAQYITIIKEQTAMLEQIRLHLTEVDHDPKN
jgi:large-conductance mechanosensitive channel